MDQEDIAFYKASLAKGLGQFCEDTIANFRIFEPGTLRASFTPGPKQCVFVVLSGENATGKSLMTMAIGTLLQNIGVTFYHTSMSRRATGGVMRAFTYGSEDDESTGAISVKSFLNILNTSTKAEDPHFILLDEPTLGLSPAYAKAMGTRLREFLQSPPSKLKGLVLVSHDVTFMGNLQDTPHHFLRLLLPKEGEANAPKSIKDMLSMELEDVSLEDLKVRARETWLKIHKKLDKRR